MIRHRFVSSLAALLTLIVSSTCASLAQQPRTSAPPQPDAAEGAVYRADLKDGKLVATAIEPPPRVVTAKLHQTPHPEPAPPPPEPTPPLQKLHPRLLEWLEKNDRSEIVEVMVGFKDSVQVPRFPALDPRFADEHPENQKALAEAESLVRQLESTRAPIYVQRLQTLAEYGAQGGETFWLIDAVCTRMPLGRVPELAQLKEVLAIEPVDSGDPPPRDLNPNNDVDDGRARIVSDPYFNLGLGEQRIALLDTGVRFTHRLLAPPARIRLRGDCVNGGTDCKTGTNLNPNDDCWNHGTSSAAILIGNDVAGNEFRGVTRFTLASFKVYPTTFNDCFACIGSVDPCAAVRGFAAAVQALDKVIVAEIQGREPDQGPISEAANKAFDAGAVVVAATGNFGSKVAAPAKASKVLGIGSFDVITGSVDSGQGHGPTSDKRIKPDLQAPTNTETAGTGCEPGRDCTDRGSDEAFQVFGETSGATPYAGGAAALLRSLMAQVMGTNNVHPGLVYALMILSGREVFPFSEMNGTGPFRLPTDGSLRWGAIDVHNGETIEIALDFRRPQRHLDAALWWPEAGVLSLHNNIDLKIVDPSGTEKESSESVPSVFERARFQGVMQGTWHVQIQGTSVGGGASQKVYFAIFNRPMSPP